MRNKNLEAERCSWHRINKCEASHLHQCLSQVGPLLNDLAVFLQKGAEEQAEVLDEVLLIVLPVGIGQPDVCVQRQHLRRRKHKSSCYLNTLICV